MTEHAGIRHCTSEIVDGKECQDNYIHAADLGHCVYLSYVQFNQELFASYRVATNLENVENLGNAGNLKNCENLQENSGKFELKFWKKPGKLRENEKYVT